MSDHIVLDNSVVMTWCFKDEACRYGDRILERLAVDTAYVPSIWSLEVCNVLLVAERQKRISQSDSARFMTLLADLPIIVEQEDAKGSMREIFALARTYGLSSYDAAYLDLAMRKGLPVATLDKNLLSAAKKAKVPIA